MFIVKESKEEDILFYVDVLDFSSSLTFEQREKYIKILKDKYNYNYKQKYNDLEKIKNISLSDDFSKKDFSDYNNYKKYCLIYFKMRRFKSNLSSNYYDVITISEVEKFVSKFPIKVEKNKNFSDFLAYVNTNNIVMPEKSYKGVIIHELGHVVQHLTKYHDGFLTDIKYSPSEYGTTNGGECFAESFTHYILDSNYKKEFADCSKEFEKPMFKKYVSLAKEIMKNN